MAARPVQPGDAIRELLALRLIATLGTLNDDGSILLTPVWYLHEDGALYLPTGSRSRKVRNVQARPQVTVLVDQRRPDSHRWASATGTATILGGAEAAAVNARARARYVNAAGERTYGELLAEWDDVTIVVSPDSWQSWTPGALERLAERHGLTGSRLAEWFEPWD